MLYINIHTYVHVFMYIHICLHACTIYVGMLLLSRFSHVRLCNPIDGSPPGSSVPGILQARTLEWVAISFSNAFRHAKSLQLCPTLCNPVDSSLPGSSVHKILQARILGWVAISFSEDGHTSQIKTYKNFSSNACKSTIFFSI